MGHYKSITILDPMADLCPRQSGDEGAIEKFLLKATAQKSYKEESPYMIQ